MTIENAEYQEDGGVSAVVDGIRKTFPAHPKNSVFKRMTADGVTPAKYVKPAPTLQDQIRDLEAKVTPSRLREAVLGDDADWLAEANERIKTLRKKVI